MQCTNSTPCNVHCAQPVRGYFTYGQCCITLNVPIFFREGCTNENPEKVWSFAKPPSDPPGLAFFPNKKFTPILFLKIASIMAKTNFALGPTLKKITLLMVIICPELAGFK